MPSVQLKVRLLRYTPNPDEMVATAARLCYSDADIDALADRVEQQDQGKFIRRLMGMGHLSTVEHVAFTFGVEGVSRALLAQLTRHRIASFSVKSQRYVGAVPKEEGDTFSYIVPPSIADLGPEAVADYEAQMQTMQGWYNGWVERLGGGEEKTFEDARFVLPNAAETKLIMTMNARELLHFFQLRCCNRAQWEIRAMAWEMLRQVKQVAPYLFEQAGPACLRGACPEGKKTCGKAGEVQEKARTLDMRQDKE